MTDQEKVWFDEIAQNRQDAWNLVLSRRAFRNIMRGVVEKYAGMGHFVYELLQNADDVNATEAKFELLNDRLVFRHNGNIHFTVTSLASEEDDAAETGHLNAITSVGASTKVLENKIGNAIGKFGVGFKAVFKYTNRPEIYDDNMAFALEHYIVPKLIDGNYPDRKSGETVFVFPFDREDKPKAREEIWQALRSLVFPTLFLSHLKRVTYSFGDQSGEYKVDCLFRADNVGKLRVAAQKLNVVAKTPLGSRNTALWLFTSESEGQRCCVGYVVNDAGEVVPADYFAFCFFPTRHQTKLKFIVHAPFLLTDSREGILSGSDHNDRMIKQLASLAAEGIKYLCSRYKDEGFNIVTEDIVKVIPISCDDYGDGISFAPFRSAFYELFDTSAVLPTRLGYVDRPHAYWPESIATPVLFSDSQLESLYGVSGIKWAFPTIPRENRSRNVGKELTSDVFDFIEYCTYVCVYDNNLIGRLSADFVEAQPMEWLEKLYDWIADNKDRVNKARTAPIFFNQHGKACAVADEKGNPILYLPLEGEDRYDMVKSELLENEHARRLLEKYNLKEPDRRDWIQMIIAQKLPNASQEEVDGWISQILCHYVSCGEEEQIEISRQLMNIACWKSTNGGDLVFSAKDLYLESDELHAYFDRIGGAKYLDAKRYLDMVDGRYSQNIITLFSRVGISQLPRFDRSEIPRNEKFRFYTENKARFSFERSTRDMSFVEANIDGLERYIRLVVNENPFAKRKADSLFLWKILTDIATEKALSADTADVADYFRRFMIGTYSYFFSCPRSQNFVSRNYTLLRETAWLVSSSGSMVSPAEAAGDMLDPEYSSLPDFSVVCSMLNIVETSDAACETSDEQKARDGLSDIAKEDLQIGELARKLGLNVDDLRKAAIAKSLEKVNDKSVREPVVDKASSNKGKNDATSNDIGTFERLKDVVDKTVRKTRDYKKERPAFHEDEDDDGMALLPAVDSDPMQPEVVDFEQKAEELRNRLASQIKLLEDEAELQSEAVEAEEYSYAWLKARLELEMRAYGADDEGGETREASVSFAKMERVPGTDNMFMLSATSESIPQWFEEEVNQRLTIRIPGRQDIETVIESMSVLSFRLKAKVKILDGMENIDYSQVVEAKTVATKPEFLLKELLNGYEVLCLSPDYNLKANLPKDIRFIFGPPGTGKTTHLARKELIPLAKSDEHPHVLVLTPTNKAADVLTNRIIKECGDDDSYNQWLTRFGITLDTSLQGTAVARAKEVEIDDAHSAVVVTTIIRFAYDAFTSMGKCKLSDFEWDYIVIDEASMIPLMQILYPIYKAKKASFIIAGDPMQIAPVVKCELSVDQNIYTMVGLEDFANPKTEPYDYEVTPLDTQYRSVPCVGRIFSEFAYSGKLKHHRSAEEERPLDLPVEGLPSIRPLTLLRFPVSRFESIFKIKLLEKSSYQIYSALFVFEFICKVVQGLKASGRTGFHIGVISPYRAQADIVGRLVGKLDKKALDGVDVNVGTVHSFQGDECEMIIALLNPPPGMGRSERSFINNKRVLNVAISRARDYLVVAMPDENTPNVQFLRGPNAIARLMRQTPGVFEELETPDLEESVWSDRDYIEKNTYSTGHQNVNVYETPEKRFEVRSEKAALDVHFRADRSESGQDEGFVSERQKIEIQATAEEQAKSDFVVPEGFHKPTEGERVPAMKQYYVIGNDEPLECESEAEEIDLSQVLAIED